MARNRLLVSWALKSCLSLYVQRLCSWSLLLLLRQKPPDPLQRLFIPRSICNVCTTLKARGAFRAPGVVLPIPMVPASTPRQAVNAWQAFPGAGRAAQPASWILPPPKSFNNHLDQPRSFIHCVGQSHRFFFINAGRASGRDDVLLYLVCKLFSEDVSFLPRAPVPALLTSQTGTASASPLSPPRASGRPQPCYRTLCLPGTEADYGMPAS